MKIPGSPLLTIRDLEKHYSGKLVIEVSSLTFDEGLYWLKGDNGSGKSTLFRCLAGLIPFTGSVTFADGITLHNHPVNYRRRVTFSEAEPQYPDFLSGRDLIKFVSQARKASNEQVQALIRSFRMEDYINHSCHTYSSGMLKKLSIVMAFLGEPCIVILDEPFITLDETARNTLNTVMKGYLKNNTTFLISSHQTAELDDLPLKATYLVSNHQLHKL